MYISIFLQLAFSAQHCLLNWSRVVHLEMLLAPVCIPLAQVWCQPVAWAALCQLRPLPKTTYQLKHKPFLFLFAPSRADTHGCPTQKFGCLRHRGTGAGGLQRLVLLQGKAEAFCILLKRCQQNWAPAAHSSSLHHSPWNGVSFLVPLLSFPPTSWDHLPKKDPSIWVQVLVASPTLSRILFYSLLLLRIPF